MPGGIIAPGILVFIILPAEGKVTVTPFTVIPETEEEPAPPQKPKPPIVRVLAAVLLKPPRGVTEVTAGAAVVMVTKLVPVAVPPAVVTRML